MNQKHSVPTRGQFLQRMATGVGIAAVGSALPAFADHRFHPLHEASRISNRNTWVKNMDVIAHMLPGEDRGKMQFMSRRKVAAADTQHLRFELSEPWQPVLSPLPARNGPATIERRPM